MLNLALLGVFKYTGFVVDTLKAVFPFMRSYATPIIPLPIGISFYTFQAMSYVIDVYRNDTSVQKNPVYFGTYVALFPQLIAGPIVRYRDIADQLENRHENVAQFASGIKLFTVGLAKKFCLQISLSLFGTFSAKAPQQTVFSVHGSESLHIHCISISISAAIQIWQ